MASSLLSGLAGKLLGELCAPFLKDVGKFWGYGTKDEFQKLKNTLSAINAVLLDAEETQRTNHQVQDWLKKIKLAFYDVEDLLQEFSTAALKRHVKTKNNKRAKKVRCFLSSSNPVILRLKMGRKVKLIREKLDAIALDRNSFNFTLTERREEMPHHVVRSSKRRETHSYVHPENVVGRHEDIEHVTKLLFESGGEKNVSVISVIGIGGLGKTTLAQSVYNSEKIKEYFELKVWVCVSDPFHVKVICAKIVECATGNKCEGFQMERVKDEIKKAIDGKRYLLVLDDVWNESPTRWMELEELLMGGARGSKILITARAELVARAAKSGATHTLKGLSPEESWSLFKQVAFEGGVEPASSVIVGIGKEALERCVGVPLAIKTIGGMLGLKERESDWLAFRNNDLPRITRDSEGDIAPILKLSYDYLPAPLKRCFAYCAVFPKDYKIIKDTLIRMWMAEGLIHLQGGTCCLEDVGEQHFMDLLDRSLIEVNSSYDGDGTESCKMHDLIHDLARSIVVYECCNLGLDTNDVDETTRHVSVSKDIPMNVVHATKLRTLFVAFETDGEVFTHHGIIGNFKHMRTLYLVGYRMRWAPDFVKGLRNLSYLNLSGSAFNFLPDCICNLYSLQSLILRECDNLQELPRGMRNLVSLRHLDILGCQELSHMPHGLGELTSLQTLSHFVMGSERQKYCSELGELKNLISLRGGLTIRNLRGETKVEGRKMGGSSRRHPADHFLTQLGLLRSLVLHWSLRGRLKAEEEAADLVLFERLKPHTLLEELSICCYNGKKFPSWMDRAHIRLSMAHIVSIELRGCWQCKKLPPFGLLPSLQKLRLQDMHHIKYLHEDDQWNIDDSGAICGGRGSRGEDTSEAPGHQLFPSLKVLILSGLRRLTRGVGPAPPCCTNSNNYNLHHNHHQHFPILEILTVRDCPLFAAEMRVVGMRTTGSNF